MTLQRSANIYQDDIDFIELRLSVDGAPEVLTGTWSATFALKRDKAPIIKTWPDSAFAVTDMGTYTAVRLDIDEGDILAAAQPNYTLQIINSTTGIRADVTVNLLNNSGS